MCFVSGIIIYFLINAIGYNALLALFLVLLLCPNYTLNVLWLLYNVKIFISKISYRKGKPSGLWVWETLSNTPPDFMHIRLPISERWANEMQNKTVHRFVPHKESLSFLSTTVLREKRIKKNEIKTKLSSWMVKTISINFALVPHFRKHIWWTQIHDLRSAYFLFCSIMLYEESRDGPAYEKCPFNN